MFGHARQWSVATRLFALQLLGIFVLVGVAVAWIAGDSRVREERQAAERVSALSAAIAENPFVAMTIARANPSVALQPYAESLLRGAEVDFVTIMLPDRTRLTHPDPGQIGQPFMGTIGPALAGRTFTETFAGTLGPSVRTVAPIHDASGAIIALVASGITLRTVSEAINAQVPSAIAIAIGAAAIAALGSWLLSRSLRAATWGRRPDQIRRMFSYYESVLHSVREGLVLSDPAGRVVLYNDQAAEMLGLRTQHLDEEGIAIDDLPVSPALRAAIGGGARLIDEIHFTRDLVLVVNQEPALPSGRFAPRVAMGTVTSLRDETEITRVSNELHSTRVLSDALRSQTHEFANRLHTIVSLIELGRADEALRLATGELAGGRQLADDIVGTVSEPVLAALLMGKSAQAHERGVALHLDCAHDLDTSGISSLDLVTVLGNLVDNALDAATPRTPAVLPCVSPDPVPAAPEHDARPWVEIYLANLAGVSGERRLVLQISDSGSGLDRRDLARAAERGYSTKDPGAHGRGLGLALVAQTVARHGGTIEARREPRSAITVELPLPLPLPPGGTR